MNFSRKMFLNIEDLNKKGDRNNFIYKYKYCKESWRNQGFNNLF